MFLFVSFIVPFTIILYWLKNKQVNLELLTLGERMKYYESLSEEVTKILPYQSFIVRLDGKNFKAVTKNLQKPFDDVFIEAMVKTAKNLIEEYHASTVYVQSDEISIVFKAVCTKDEYEEDSKKYSHLFGGRTTKLLSILAGYTSTKFTVNFYNGLLQSSNTNEAHKLYLKKLSGDDVIGNQLQACNFCFDARITLIPLNKSYEVVNNLLWRSVHDSYRNFVSGVCYEYFSKSSLNRLKTNERKELLKKEHGIDLDNYASHYKYGWLLKSQLEDKEQDIRKNIVAKSFKIHYSEEIEDMLYSKYWNDVSDTILFDETKSFN